MSAAGPDSVSLTRCMLLDADELGLSDEILSRALRCSRETLKRYRSGHSIVRTANHVEMAEAVVEVCRRGVLRHKPGKGAGTGARSYYQRIGIQNLVRVAAAIRYPAAVGAAYRELVILSTGEQ